jgi:hypothetical protein
MAIPAQKIGHPIRIPKAIQPQQRIGPQSGLNTIQHLNRGLFK